MKLPNAVQIKLVKSSSTDQTDDTITNLYPTPAEVAEYATIAGYWSKQAAKGVAVLYVGKKVVDLAADLGRIAATSHIIP